MTMVCASAMSMRSSPTSAALRIPQSRPTPSSSAAARRPCSNPPSSAGSSRPAATRSTSRQTPKSRSKPIPNRRHAATLEGFRAAGANRLSFGVQSFRDEELRRLGRLHSSDGAREAVRVARAAGFDNLSLDLMMWLPGQSTDRVAVVGGRADRPAARSRVALSARDLSECATTRRNGARRVVGGAGRRCGGDVSGGLGAARSRGLRAV